MPFILFNSRQRRRVLVISFKQSFSKRTTYISSGILQKPTTPSLHSHSYTKHQLDLSSQAQTLKLSQSHQNTQTESTSPFMVTSETPIKSKVRCYNHSNTHAYEHTSHSKTQAEGRGTYIHVTLCISNVRHWGNFPRRYPVL